MRRLRQIRQNLHDRLAPNVQIREQLLRVRSNSVEIPRTAVHPHLPVELPLIWHGARRMEARDACSDWDSGVGGEREGGGGVVGVD
jgi:hypothetical protein